MMGSRGRGGRARTAGSLGLILANSASTISGISRFFGSGARLSRHSALGMPARRAVTWVTEKGLAVRAPRSSGRVPRKPGPPSKSTRATQFIRECCFKRNPTLPPRHRTRVRVCVRLWREQRGLGGGGVGSHTCSTHASLRNARARTLHSPACAQAQAATIPNERQEPAPHATPTRRPCARRRRATLVSQAAVDEAAAATSQAARQLISRARGGEQREKLA
jgi:hypothetical protein